MTIDDWPDCAHPGCPHKCCKALDSVYCFPHTVDRHTARLLLAIKLPAATKRQKVTA